MSFQNTKKHTKVTVFRRIGQVLFPEWFELDGTTIANRIKGKIEGLEKEYKKHAAKLRQTGGGIDHDNADGENATTLKFYIPADGPEDNASEEAKNLWGARVLQLYFSC